MEGCQNKEYIMILVCNRCVVQELPEPEMLSSYLITFSSLNLSCSLTNENFWHQQYPMATIKIHISVVNPYLIPRQAKEFFQHEQKFPWPWSFRLWMVTLITQLQGEAVTKKYLLFSSCLKLCSVYPVLFPR